VLSCGLIGPAEDAVVSKEGVVAANGRSVLVLLYAYATPHATLRPSTRSAVHFGLQYELKPPAILS
jgi:hypothetical protein